MPKYRVKSPIGYSGRRERGEIIEMPEDMAKSFARELEPYEGEKEAVNANEEKSLEDFTYAELKAKAGELGLPKTGSAADLRESIALHLEGKDADDEEVTDEADDSDETDEVEEE